MTNIKVGLIRYSIINNTVWPENLTGIKFDEIASKLHNKNMTDFKFDEMPGKKAPSIRKINIDGY